MTLSRSVTGLSGNRSRCASRLILNSKSGRAENTVSASLAAISAAAFQALDNDDVPLWNPYVELIKLHAPDLWQRLTIIETPSDGHHIPFRCDTIEGNQPLARRPRTIEVAAGTKGAKEKDGKWYVEKFDILFETRGEGGYIVAPGSPLNVHLAGKPYRFIKGSLDTIPKITADERALLFNLARAFDECEPTRQS